MTAIVGEGVARWTEGGDGKREGVEGKRGRDWWIE